MGRLPHAGFLAASVGLAIVLAVPAAADVGSQSSLAEQRPATVVPEKTAQQAPPHNALANIPPALRGVLEAIGTNAAIRSLAAKKAREAGLVGRLAAELKRRYISTPLITGPIFESWGALEYSPISQAAYYGAPYYMRMQAAYGFGIYVTP